MSFTFLAVFRNGVFVPDRPMPFPEGTEVLIDLIEETATDDDATPMRPLKGTMTIVRLGPGGP